MSPRHQGTMSSFNSISHRYTSVNIATAQPIQPNAPTQATAPTPASTSTPIKHHTTPSSICQPHPTQPNTPLTPNPLPHPKNQESKTGYHRNATTNNDNSASTPSHIHGQARPRRGKKAETTRIQQPTTRGRRPYIQDAPPCLPLTLERKSKFFSMIIDLRPKSPNGVLKGDPTKQRESCTKREKGRRRRESSAC